MNKKFIIPISLYKNNKYNSLRRSELLILSEILEKYDEFKVFELNKKSDIIINIESSCYNYVLNKSKKISYITSWDNPQFKYLYRLNISKITKHLDIDSEVNNRYLFDNIINNNISITNIPYLSSYELCPDRSKDIIDKIQLRSNQTISHKTSTMYTCRNCKQKKVTMKEVQMRSCDEGSNLSITCTFCNFHWIV